MLLVLCDQARWQISRPWQLSSVAGTDVLGLQHLQLLMPRRLCSADLRLVLLLQDGVEDVQHSSVLQDRSSVAPCVPDLQPKDTRLWDT